VDSVEANGNLCARFKLFGVPDFRTLLKISLYVNTKTCSCARRVIMYCQQCKSLMKRIRDYFVCSNRRCKDYLWE
jgi:hypothetical protein